MKQPGQAFLLLLFFYCEFIIIILAVLWSSLWGFPGGSDDKESFCNAGGPVLSPGSERCPGEGNDNPLQYSCLDSPLDREAFKAIVHRVTKSHTRLKWLFLLLSCSFVSHSLWSHRLEHASLPWPSSSSGAFSNSCPISWWCHPSILSSVIPLSFNLQSFPASESF